jgi:hypothetical protein
MIMDYQEVLDKYVDPAALKSTLINGFGIGITRLRYVASSMMRSTISDEHHSSRMGVGLFIREAASSPMFVHLAPLLYHSSNRESSRSKLSMEPRLKAINGKESDGGLGRADFGIASMRHEMVAY